MKFDRTTKTSRFIQVVAFITIVTGLIVVVQLPGHLFRIHRDVKRLEATQDFQIALDNYLVDLARQKALESDSNQIPSL